MFFLDDTKDKNLYIIIFILAATLIVLTITFLDALGRALGKNVYSLPKILYSSAPPSLYNGSLALLILEYSEIFAYDQLVSIYLKDSEMEIFVGVGYICNIQSDKKIQVSLLRVENGNESLVTQLINNNSEIHRKLLVKPPTKSSIIAYGGSLS